MTSLATRVAMAAESMVGTHFRLHGRTPGVGLDCVGLVSTSLNTAGVVLPNLPDYNFRNLDYAPIMQLAAAAGFLPASGRFHTGDIIVVKPGPAQRHFLIASGPETFIHAHAGLRKVVIMPGPVPWPVWAILRFTEGD